MSTTAPKIAGYLNRSADDREFVMIGRSKIRGLARVNVDAAVYLYMSMRGATSRIAFPSQRTIALDLGIAKSTVNKALQTLCDRGALRLVLKGAGKRPGKYLVHDLDVLAEREPARSVRTCPNAHIKRNSSTKQAKKPVDLTPPLFPPDPPAVAPPAPPGPPRGETKPEPVPSDRLSETAPADERPLLARTAGAARGRSQARAAADGGAPEGRARRPDTDEAARILAALHIPWTRRIALMARSDDVVHAWAKMQGRTDLKNPAGYLIRTVEGRASDAGGFCSLPVAEARSRRTREEAIRRNKARIAALRAQLERDKGRSAVARIDDLRRARADDPSLRRSDGSETAARARSGDEASTNRSGESHRAGSATAPAGVSPRRRSTRARLDRIQASQGSELRNHVTVGLRRAHQAIRRLSDRARSVVRREGGQR